MTGGLREAVDTCLTIDPSTADDAAATAALLELQEVDFAIVTGDLDFQTPVDALTERIADVLEAAKMRRSRRVPGHPWSKTET